MLLRAVYEANLVVIRSWTYLAVAFAVLWTLYSLFTLCPKFTVEGAVMGFFGTLGLLILFREAGFVLGGLFIGGVSIYHLIKVISDTVLRWLDLYGGPTCFAVTVAITILAWGLIVCHKYIEAVVLNQQKINKTST